MRVKGLLCSVYLDESLVLASTKELAAEGAAQLVDLLNDLGLTVNFYKSQLTPVQQIVYLGFLINLQEGTIQIPDGKVHAPR